MKVAMSSHLHGSISSVRTYGVRVPEPNQWIHEQLVICLKMKKEQNMEYSFNLPLLMHNLSDNVILTERSNSLVSYCFYRKEMFGASQSIQLAIIHECH